MIFDDIEYELVDWDGKCPKCHARFLIDFCKNCGWAPEVILDDDWDEPT